MNNVITPSTSINGTTYFSTITAPPTKAIMLNTTARINTISAIALKITILSPPTKVDEFLAKN